MFAAKFICYWGADAKSACTRSVKNTCTGDAWASNTYDKGTCRGNAFFIVSAYIKSADPRDTCTEGVGRKITCIWDIGAVNYSKIYLQSFSILEMGLFKIRFKTRVEIGW